MKKRNVRKTKCSWKSWDKHTPMQANHFQRFVNSNRASWRWFDPPFWSVPICFICVRNVDSQPNQSGSPTVGPDDTTAGQYPTPARCLQFHTCTRGRPDVSVSAPRAYDPAFCSALLNRAHPASIADTRLPTGTIQIKPRMCVGGLSHTLMLALLCLQCAHTHTNAYTNTWEVLAEG